MAYVDKLSLGGTLYDITDTKGRAMIAPKEETSTASAAHAEGTYFTYNDLLYRATADIAAGGTITPNTNCVAATVGGEVTERSKLINNVINNNLDNIIIPDDYYTVTGILSWDGRVNSSQTGFKTTDYIEIDKNLIKFIESNSVRAPGSSTCLCLYTINKEKIDSLSGFTIIDISQYPTAYYIRASKAVSASNTYYAKLKTDSDIEDRFSVFATAANSYFSMIDNNEVINYVTEWFDDVLVWPSSSGEPVINSEFSSTNYIEIDSNKEYHIRGKNGSTVFYSFYDNSKQYITGSYILNNREYVLTTEYIQENSVKYIILSIPIANKSDLVLSTSAYSVSDTVARKTIYVGTGHEYTDLKTAVEYAYSRGNVDIILGQETYTVTADSSWGITIGNNMRIIGNPRAKIVCNYTGGSSGIEEKFSIFNTGNGDFELIGLNLDGTNIRYCVHDDNGESTTFYTHVYRGCDMKLDNSQSSWTAPQCIGGGFGKTCRIEIIDCVFDTETTSSAGYAECASYHNNVNADARSEIVVRGCYFKPTTGTFRLGYYGASTEVSTALISNNNMGVAPVLRAETSSSTNENIEMIAWNNYIRT